MPLPADRSLLGALSAPASSSSKAPQRLAAGVERYPVQLHDLERGVYLEMKRKEIHRQQALG